MSEFKVLRSHLIIVFLIFRALSKLVKQRPGTWDEHLDAIMFGLRTKKPMTTKYSPYFLMFGREARYPSEVPQHYMVGEPIEIESNLI